MAQYKTGTVSVTNGSATVTGSGTSWSANLSAGDYFYRVGDLVAYEVASVASDTSLTLTAPYGGETGSGASYVGHVDFHPNGAPKFDKNDVDTWAIMNAWVSRFASAGVLGTAAGFDAQTSVTDATAGRLMQVGAFGAGTTAGSYLFGRSNLLGTVSQSGGVPTGAVIERGSNANGEYVKFADGTLICTFDTVAASATSFGTGTYTDPWRSLSSSWAFPSTFISPPLVSGLAIRALSGASRACYVAGEGVTTTQFQNWQAVAHTNDIAPDVKLTAIGRWF